MAENEETELLPTNKAQGWGDWLANKCCFWYTAPNVAVAKPDNAAS